MPEDPVIQLPGVNQRSGRNRLAIIAVQFITLFAFWLILSGHYDATHIFLGVLAAGLVTFLTNDLFYSLFYRVDGKGTNIRFILLRFWYFLTYLIWLFSRIVKANIQVAYLVLHPRMPIDPALLQFHTRMRRILSQVTLANSITLTPGTITVNLEDGRYVIHALVPSATGDILDARMQNRIAPIFGDDEEKPPAVEWVYSIKEPEP